ncbi:MAG: FeoC-like transcriptional regulator [Thermoplasmata archaeon]|nr:FeoC-like transcriptional regulator [Thermoplasmata archaeon]
MSKGDFSLIEMAQNLSISQDELKNRMHMMKHMGYITAEDVMDTRANGGCALCPSAKTCSDVPRTMSMKIVTYQLTEKGKRVCGI